MSDPTVSVLMPIYNTQKYLREAILSILNQTHLNFELIAIDDGSTDNSPTILADLASRDLRIKPIYRENRGAIETRNELIQRSKGKYLAWMDSDDISLSERLSLQHAILESNENLSCVGTNIQCITPNGAYLHREIYPILHNEIRVAQQTGGGVRFASTMMRRSAVVLAGGFRPPFTLGEDLDFLLRLGEIGQLRNIPETLYKYRQHVSSICAYESVNWHKYRNIILQLADERSKLGSDKLQRGEFLDIKREAWSSNRSRVASIYTAWSRSALENGDRFTALKYAMAAIVNAPISVRSIKTLVKSMIPRNL